MPSFSSLIQQNQLSGNILGATLAPVSNNPTYPSGGGSASGGQTLGNGLSGGTTVTPAGGVTPGSGSGSTNTNGTTSNTGTNTTGSGTAAGANTETATGTGNTTESPAFYMQWWFWLIVGVAAIGGYFLYKKYGK